MRRRGLTIFQYLQQDTAICAPHLEGWKSNASAVVRRRFASVAITAIVRIDG